MQTSEWEASDVSYNSDSGRRHYAELPDEAVCSHI